MTYLESGKYYSVIIKIKRENTISPLQKAFAPVYLPGNNIFLARAMYLFFNGVSSDGYIALISEQRDIKVSGTFQIAGNESTKTAQIIDNFIKENDIKFTEIKNIICVVGPGSFTGIRTISLVVNTLAYVHPHISLTPVSFFDLYGEYPIVKASSKRDLFVMSSKCATIEIVSNDDFEHRNEHSTIYGDLDTQRFEKEFHLSSDIDYATYIKNVELLSEKRVSPMYIKKPNIS